MPPFSSKQAATGSVTSRLVRDQLHAEAMLHFKCLLRLRRAVSAGTGLRNSASDSAGVPGVAIGSDGQR